jgi:hypothetical protein
VEELKRENSMLLVGFEKERNEWKEGDLARQRHARAREEDLVISHSKEKDKLLALIESMKPLNAGSVSGIVLYIVRHIKCIHIFLYILCSFR